MVVKWSKLKPAEKFNLTWFEHGFDGAKMVREYKFSKTRKFRLDFAWTQFSLGVEIHGFGFGHQAQQGLAADCEKIRHAMECGWTIIPFTTRCISSRENCYQAVAFVCERISEIHQRHEEERRWGNS